MRTHVLQQAMKYIQVQPDKEQAFIRVHITTLAEGNSALVRTKQLKGAIRELIVRHHRLTYFQFAGDMYLVRGFRKKSVKTPRKEIEYAEQVYKIITQS